MIARRAEDIKTNYMGRDFEEPARMRRIKGMRLRPRPQPGPERCTEKYQVWETFERRPSEQLINQDILTAE